MIGAKMEPVVQDHVDRVHNLVLAARPSIFHCLSIRARVRNYGMRYLHHRLNHPRILKSQVILFRNIEDKDPKSILEKENQDMNHLPVEQIVKSVLSREKEEMNIQD